MIDSPWFYILAVAAILLVGISKSGFGSGLGVLGVPLMALVMPPQQAAAILLPLLCVMDLFNVWHYRRIWDRANLVILIPAALVGILGGALFFHYFSEAQIRILVGAIAVAFALRYFFQQAGLFRQDPVNGAPPSKAWGWFWGAIAGFTSFGVHAGGPPVNMYLLPQKLEKSIFVGTTVIFFAVVNYVKLVPYFFLGQFSGENLLTSLLFSPLAPLGTWMGIRLHHRINEGLFYLLAYIFLLIAGGKLLYEGLLMVI